jgi:hypothetical protein
MMGSSPMAFIPTAQSRSRSRTWERDQRSEVGQATYRIPYNLRDEVTNLAKQLNVSTSEIARYLLEYGLTKVFDGSLVLNPKLKTGRFTLFTNNDHSDSPS